MFDITTIDESENKILIKVENSENFKMSSMSVFAIFAILPFFTSEEIEIMNMTLFYIFFLPIAILIGYTRFEIEIENITNSSPDVDVQLFRRINFGGIYQYEHFVCKISDIDYLKIGQRLLQTGRGSLNSFRLNYLSIELPTSIEPEKKTRIGLTTKQKVKRNERELFVAPISELYKIGAYLSKKLDKRLQWTLTQHDTFDDNVGESFQISKNSEDKPIFVSNDFPGTIFEKTGKIPHTRLLLDDRNMGYAILVTASSLFMFIMILLGDIYNWGPPGEEENLEPIYIVILILFYYGFYELKKGYKRTYFRFTEDKLRIGWELFGNHLKEEISYDNIRAILPVKSLQGRSKILILGNESAFIVSDLPKKKQPMMVINVMLEIIARDSKSLIIN